MNTRILISLAAVSCVCLRTHAYAQAAPALDVLPALNWTDLDQVGSLPTTAQLVPRYLPTRAMANRSHNYVPVYRTTFSPHGRYSAALPMTVRSEGTCASFNLSGRAAADPNDGTVLTIDGASLGYKLEQHPGSPAIVRVVATTYLTGATTATWVPLNIVVLPHGGSELWRGPRLTIRFHPPSGTYDVLVNNVLSRAGLKLANVASESPIVTLSSGNAGRPPVLTSLRIGAAPSGGGVLPVDAAGHLLHNRKEGKHG